MMGQEEELEIYRSQLLESLHGQSGRSVRSASEPIQVYINEHRVGELDGTGIGTTLRVQYVDHIDIVQLRTEEGVLLGGLAAPEHGFRTDRIRLSSDTIELCVHNTGHGGSLSAVFIPAPGFWSQTWKSLAGFTDKLMTGNPAPAIAYGMRTVVFAQALLAIAVVGLVADRMTLWMTPHGTPSPVLQTVALPAASVADMAKLEQQLDELTRMQAKVGEVLESQHKGMTQLHQTMAKLSLPQESTTSGVMMVNEETLKEEVKEQVKEQFEKRHVIADRETDRPSRHVASKGPVEQEQLEAAIHSLTADNDRLSKEVAGLEEHNQALKAKLHAAVVTASKAVDPGPERLLKMADSLQATQQAPFLFWVTFSDGTSQESIDKWVHEIKGHKGALNEGWQEVRIGPPAVPPDRFLEQIRGDKIVKAARIGQ